ncbi:MAG: hypothetical protein HKN06_00290, partial [Gammaproteobacteria bacterium]|nr:hypothetical protein [Gammaproteobacteria bacterium]
MISLTDEAPAGARASFPALTKPLLLVVCCLLQGCSMADTAGFSWAAELEQARQMIGPGWPADADSYPTTSGAVYTANLDSQIEAIQPLLDRRYNEQLLVKLARLRYHRFQLRADFADLERLRQLLAHASNQPHGVAVD